MAKIIHGIAVLCICSASSAAAQVTVDAYYRGEVWQNAHGGIDTGSAYLDDAGLLIDADLSSRKPGARLFAYLLWNNGTTFSDRYVGDFQVVSNIDAEEALRLYELWYEQPIAGRTSLRIGLYDLNAEFDALESAQLFLHSSHGIGAEYAQSGRLGPSIFPVTSLAARFDWRMTAATTLRYALLDGVPGDPDDPGRTTIRLGGDDGVLHALEVEHTARRGIRFGLGGWLYSEDFERIEGRDAAGGPLRDDGNSGVYGFIDAPLIAWPGSEVSVSSFVRYGIADERFNRLDSYLGAGIVIDGIVPRRPRDRVGLAIARGMIGGPARRADALAGRNTAGHETAIELTYSAALTDWLRIQPDIQYVIQPNGNRALDDALVIGVRFELTQRWQR